MLPSSFIFLISGMEIALVDLINIEMFAKRVISLTEYKTELAVYLHSKMEGKIFSK